MSSMSQVHGNHTRIEYDSDAYHLHDSLHHVGIEYESDTNHYMVRTNHYMIGSTLGPARHVCTCACLCVCVCLADLTP